MSDPMTDLETEDNVAAAAPPPPPPPGADPVLDSPETPEPQAAADPPKKKRRASKKKVAAKPAEVETRSPEMARVTVTTPYKMSIPGQNVVIVPGRYNRVELDGFVQAQLDAKTLAVEED